MKSYRKAFDKRNLRRRIADFLSQKGDILDKDFMIDLYVSIYSKLPKAVELKKFLKKKHIYAPITFVEHHKSHAASAFYTSPFDRDTLVLTIDASGDGVCSSLSIIDSKFLLKRISASPFVTSPASVYGYITYILGFKPGKHEGKITGLAAYGDPKKTYHIFKKAMGFRGMRFKCGLHAWGQPAADKLRRLLKGYSKEDISAGLQKRFEDVIVGVVSNALKKYPRKHIALAGGAFANVKLNQRLAEIPGIKSVFVHPHMGDGGLGVGAGLSCWADYCSRKKVLPKPVPIDNVYFGPSYNNDAVKHALSKSDLKFRQYKNVAKEVAKILAKGKIVAIFNNRMEYGPRALGARTIMSQATDKRVNDWLNQKLHRTEFMPFAPVTMKEHVNTLYKNFKFGEVAAQFMTITFDVDKKLGKKLPAVVHVDWTARPQTITPKQNKLYYDIIKEYYKITKLHTVVNTSFNMHEEPIVCTPEDAIRSFKAGCADYLMLNDFIVFPKEQ